MRLPVAAELPASFLFWLRMTMERALQFLEFVLVAFTISLVHRQLMLVNGGWASVCRCTAFGLRMTLLFAPLLIEPEYVRLRALACVVAIDQFFKTTEYAAFCRQPQFQQPALLCYLKFLVPFPVLHVRLAEQTCRSRWNVLQLRPAAGGLTVFGLCFLSLEWLAEVRIIRSSFAVDHTVKFVVFMIATESVAQFVHRVERFAGYDPPPLVDRAFASQSVGEFWQRFDTRVHSWLLHNVFLPLGGRRAPVRGVFLVFFVSGLLHETGFAVATSRWDGYQFIFFLLQVPVVCLERLVPCATMSGSRVKTAWHVGTVAWMWATSMLFFHGVNRVFPGFYASTPWLP